MDRNPSFPGRQHGNAQVPSLRWLAGGAVAGLLFAAYGLLERDAGQGALPPAAVARVNERVITADQLERAIARLPAVPPDEADNARQWMLQRLLEDELLVQRGIALGLPESDLTVRDAIVQSLVAS
ncbi:MAG: SurA N-terminal domain-containing protein, partial [Gammaproteobacteria bacterium]|nr:SurA N-terminal domain-containing protein [Gammaproteobacteria bacterium]